MNRTPVVAALAGALLFAGVAQAAEKLVILPLTTSGDIPPAIAEGFRGHLRTLAGSAATVVDDGAAKAAMSTAGVAPDCASDACADGVGGATGSRFVLMGTVDNTDEIYKVELSLYDRATKARKAAQGLCELCAAEEVDRTITVAFTQLRPALAVAAPAPVAAARVAIEVTTDPDGADVALDGEPQGQSPIVLRAVPGEHIVQITRAGMKPVDRKITTRQETVKLAVTLVPDPAATAPPKADVPAPVVPPTAVPTPPVTAAPGGEASESSFIYTGAGMLIGGALLTAGGIVAILLDGDVTCTDGLGRRECPTVYNTKGAGIAGLGIGAALLGAGATLIIVDVLDDSPVVPNAAIGPDGAVFGLGGRF